MGVQLSLFAPRSVEPTPSKADLLSLLPAHTRAIAAGMIERGLRVVISPPYIGQIQTVNGRTFLLDYGPELFRDGDGWRSPMGMVWREVGIQSA